MPDSQRFMGRCFCGAVEIEVQGAPVAAAICHCESCRRWHSAPVNTWAAWPAASVRIVAGRELLLEFNQHGPEGPSGRTFCSRCGSAILNRKPDYGMIVVYATVLEGSGLKYTPTFHSFYGEGVLHVADGLPKFLDLPQDLGGSGKRLEEPVRSGMRN